MSDSPMVPGAYAIQTKMLAAWLKENGHEVLIFGTTYYGARFEYDGVPVVGGAVHQDLFGDGMINYYAMQHGADFILTMKDPYVYSGNTLRGLCRPWIPVVPLDTEPMNIATKYQLAFATLPIAVTRGGQQMMKDEGIRALYAPHAIDTEFWTPGDKAAARAELQIPQHGFIAAFIGQNNSNPSRKSLDQIVLSWHVFHEQHPDSLLFLHTSLSAKYGGINLEGMIKAIRLPENSFRATKQTDYDTGNIPAEHLRTIYRAADVLINPAMGGGFELCGVEAQACGTPVITSNFTGMRETVGVGWKIVPGNGTGELIWSALGAFRMQPSKKAILDALTLAYNSRDQADTLSDAAHKFAQRYSKATVFDTHWKPALAEIEALLKGADLEHGRDTEVGQPDAARLERPREDRSDVGRAEPEAPEPVGM